MKLSHLLALTGLLVLSNVEAAPVDDSSEAQKLAAGAVSAPALTSPKSSLE